MTTGQLIDQKIRAGYSKCADKLGQPFSLYRSLTPINPIQDSNLVGTINAVMSSDWTWMKSNRYGSPIWYCCVDGQDSSDPLSAQIGDYLIGDGNFFVMSKQYQLPIQVVECNRTISIIRPSQRTDGGYIGYVAYTAASSEIIMTDMLASCLKKGSAQSAPTKLPTDTKEPLWEILLPNLGNVTIRVDDIITDEINQEYAVMQNELTELGWRITAQQTVNSR